MEKIAMACMAEKGEMTRAARWTRASVPCALLCAFFCCGCPKKKEPPPPDPSSPESYMNDEKFRGRLAAERKAHVALVRDRNAIAERMKAMIEAKKAELKTDDLKAVQAALEKDPAWNDLYSQCTNANAKVEAHSRERLGIVRDRIAPKQQKKAPVSK
ncbi:MAG: hypothetical protein IKF72_03175 [Kiritimatiellae bacterium]|nr:hypothetical protein [Kiritimatiellia bacterium]